MPSSVGRLLEHLGSGPPASVAPFVSILSMKCESEPIRRADGSEWHHVWSPDLVLLGLTLMQTEAKGQHQ